MKKYFYNITIFTILIFALIYFIYNAKIQRDNFIAIDNSINKIILLDQEFDNYIDHSLTYDNFDIIQKKINSFKTELHKIDSNEILNNIDNDSLKKQFKHIVTMMNKKITIINKVKGYRAILNNSYRIIQKLKIKYHLNKFDKIYTKIMILNNNEISDINSEINHINNISKNYTNKSEKFFLTHSKIILEYQNKFLNIKTILFNLDIRKNLYQYSNLYKKYTHKIIYTGDISILISFIFLIIFIVLFTTKSIQLLKANINLNRFKTTIENSDNIVVVTDINHKIKYVNHAFYTTYGYKEEDAIGSTPSILKSGKHKREFYKNINNMLHSGKKWSGEFINKDKYGNLRYEKASITPAFDENGNIVEFIAIKLNITDEILMEEKLKEQNQQIMKSEKMAAMGEMIGNIAHQWRQPLSVISTASTGMKLQKELDVLDDKQFLESCDIINDNAQYLSKTIDDFKNFIKGDRDKKEFLLKDEIDSFLNLINGTRKSSEIDIILNLDETIIINGYQNELTQCIINIFNNAKDALKEKMKDNRLIFITTYQKNNQAIIEIKDNAMGIPDDVMSKIFEPYFTTKHKSQGTGLGLHMSYNIITNGMKGDIKANNTTYTYENIKYTGALFTLSLPLK